MSCEGEYVFMESNMSTEVGFVMGRIKILVPFLIDTIAEKNAWCASVIKFGSSIGA